MQDNFYNITIALAGMIQTTTLAKDFAKTGKMDETAFQASVYSIFQIDPPNVYEIFGGLHNLKIGFEKLIELFSPTFSSPRSQMRYLVSLIQMQKKIMRNAKVHDRLKQRLQQAKKQAEYFSFTHPTVIANLADIYLDAISPFNFRILMWGNQRVLGANENMEKIRTLLLAGIRSTVLWRQVGGSRWHLLFSRTRIKAIAKKVLTEIEGQQVK